MKHWVSWKCPLDCAAAAGWCVMQRKILTGHDNYKASPEVSEAISTRKGFCIFLMDPRFGIRFVLLKLLLILNLLAKPKTHCIYFCLQESQTFLQEFSNQIKIKNWKKPVAEPYTTPFRSGLREHFIFICWISPDAFPSGTALLHRYVIQGV